MQKSRINKGSDLLMVVLLFAFCVFITGPILTTTIPSAETQVRAASVIGKAPLPATATAKIVLSKDHYLLVATEPRDGPDLFLFQTNKFPELELRWSANFAGTIEDAVFFQSYLAIALGADEPELLHLDPDTGLILNQWTLPKKPRALFAGQVLSGELADGTLFLQLEKKAPAFFPANPLAGMEKIHRDWTLIQAPRTAAARIDSSDGSHVVLLQDLEVPNWHVTFPDIHGDGRTGLACLGDSNTIAWFRDQWCEKLETLIPDSRFFIRNFSVAGVTATGNEAGSGTHQLDAALQSEAIDALVVAFGTNDLRLRRKSWPAEEVLATYKDLQARTLATGRRFFIATTPPIFGPNEELSKTIRELNELIRSQFSPEAIIDFDSGFTASMFRPDGVHLMPNAQSLRTTRAASKIYTQSTP